ncbi:50S ribosomal protein L10 [Candidatus Saccharibacteria bacterium]|nr:50S ribosomal protein L10 [Candidatus Saccharibacteria bacterium]
MALSKQQKEDIISEVSSLLEASKLTVVANYKGTGVKQLQDLRKQAKETGTKVKIVKNRLVVKALSESEKFKTVDTSQLNEQLLYAFNSEDEVAPAQALAKFAKANPSLVFVGGITAEGEFIGADDVKALSSLPSKDQLRAQLIGTINAPLTGFVGVLAGNVRGVMNVLNARAEQIG